MRDFNVASTAQHANDLTQRGKACVKSDKQRSFTECWLVELLIKRNFACLHKLEAKYKEWFIGRVDVKDDHSNLIHDTVIYMGRIKCVIPSKGTDKVLLAQSPAPSQLLLMK